MSSERRDPRHERFDDLKEAYVLGALTEDERREFEDILAAHPELQAEVDDLESTANLLTLAPIVAGPPTRASPQPPEQYPGRRRRARNTPRSCPKPHGSFWSRRI